MRESANPPHVGRARALVFLAAVMWSTSGLFAKAPFFAFWPAEHRGGALAFWRAVFVSVVLLPLVRKVEWSPLLVPLALAFAFMTYSFLTAMSLTTEGNAIWLQMTAPLWVLVLGVLVLRESTRPRDWITLGCGMSGVGLIVACEMQGQSVGGSWLALASGFSYAIVVLLLRRLRHLDSLWLVALNQVVTAVLLAPLAWREDCWPQGIQWPLLAVFGVLQLGIPYVLFARGLRGLAGHEATTIGLIEPILVPVWVFVAWRSHPSYQPPAWWTLAGGGLILAGLLLRYAVPWGRERQEAET